jgi:uncharacterized membrane protein
MGARTMTGSLQAATLITALGCGLVAGVLFGFSSFVMNGLDRLPAAQGVAAMQSINRTAVLAPFMIAFVGTALACLVVMVWTATSWDEKRSAWILAGGALYLIGVFGVTMVRNVPMNDKLDGFAAESAEAASYWSHYMSAWTAWNHVRVAAALAASALLIVALIQD